MLSIRLWYVHLGTICAGAKMCLRSRTLFVNITTLQYCLGSERGMKSDFIERATRICCSTTRAVSHGRSLLRKNPIRSAAISLELHAFARLAFCFPLPLF